MERWISAFEISILSPAASASRDKVRCAGMIPERYFDLPGYLRRLFRYSVGIESVPTNSIR